MADGYINIDTKIDQSGLKKGLSELESAAKKGLSALSVALGAVSTALGAAGAFAVKTGMEFDTSMAQVAATMGTSVEAIGELRDLAIELGGETVFSANEAAQALNYLALAGYDAEKAASVLPAVLDLAAAGSMDLAYASDLATDAMAALGIAANGENLTAFSDELAKTASSANTSVAELGEAILTVGGTAKMLAGGTVELNTVLGVLANRGKKGSEAGTHLRNILLALSAPTKNAKEAFEDLGVSAVDSSGNMRPLQEIFADLNVAFDGMSETAKQQYLSKIFNRYDLVAAQALLSGCTDEWIGLEEKIKDAQGATQQMSDTQLDNLAGDVEDLKGSLETLGIAVYDAVLPQLRELTRLGTDTIDQLANAMNRGGFLGLFIALGEKIAAIPEGIANLLPDLTSKFSMTFPKVVSAGKEFVENLGKGISENLPAIVKSAAEALYTLFDTYIDFRGDIFELGGRAIKAVGEGIIQSIPDLVSKLPAIITGIVDFFVTKYSTIAEVGAQLLSALFDSLPAIWESIKSIDWAGLGISILQSVLNGLLSIGNSIAGLFGETIPLVEGLEWSSLGTNIINGLGNISGLFSGLFDAGKGLAEKIDWASLGSGIISSLGNIASSLLGAFTTGKGEIEKVEWSEVGNSILNGVGHALDAGGAFLSAGFTAGKAAIEAINWDAIGTLIGSAVNGVIDVGGHFLSAGFEAAHATINAIDWQGVGELIGGYFNNIVDVTGEFLSGGFKAAANTIQGIDWAGIGNDIADGLNRAWGVISGIGDVALGIGETVVDAGKSGINAIRGWLGLDSSGGSEDAQKAGAQVAASIATGVNEKTPEIVKAAESASKALLTAFETELGISDSTSSKSKPFGEGVVTGIVDGVNAKATVSTFTAAALAVYSALQSAIDAAIGTSGGGGSAAKFIYAGEGVVSAAVDGITSKATAATFSSAASMTASAMRSALDAAVDSARFEQIGDAICDGIAAGLRSGQNSVTSAAKSVAKAALSASKAALGIKSPSRIFRDMVGKQVSAGWAVGILDNEDSVTSAVDKLADSTRKRAMGARLQDAVFQQNAKIAETATDRSSQITAASHSDATDDKQIDYDTLAEKIWEKAPDIDVNIDGERAGELLEPHVSRRQGQKAQSKNRRNGNG